MEVEGKELFQESALLHTQTWRNRDIEKLNSSIMDIKPSTFIGKRHKAMP